MKQDGKRNVVIVIVAIVVIALLGLGILKFKGCSNKKNGNSSVTNYEAEKHEKKRYLTIINKTDQILNEVKITTGDGAEIETASQKNPDSESFSIEIPKEFKEYDDFIVVAIDRYGFRYEKEVLQVKESGRTDVEITQDDYVKQKGDMGRKISKFFNGD